MPSTARGTLPCLICKSLVQMLPSVTRTKASCESFSVGIGFSSKANRPRSTYVYANILFQFFRFFILSIFFLHDFYQETNGAKAVVTRNHGRTLVLHPSVIQICCPICQSHYKRRHALPSALTKPFRLFPTIGYEDLSFFHIAGMLQRVLITLHQILVTSFTHNGDFNLPHIRILPESNNQSLYLNSQKATAEAAATLSESTPCAIGMRTT